MAAQKFTPEGMHDTLPLELRAKRTLVGRMMENFYMAGYDEIETPVVEYCEVFEDSIGAKRGSELIKFFDYKGRALALRPDMTMPIARVAATKLREAPLPMRLCYAGSAFGCDFSRGGRREFAEAGIELLGEARPEADAEVLALAVETLREAGFDGFLIELGHVGFFKALMAEAGLAEDDAEEVRALMDAKNALGMELKLNQLGLSGALGKLIRQMLNLYGDDAIERAKLMNALPSCRTALENLEYVMDILFRLGMGQYLSVDLGMVHSIGYYTGTVFRGLIREAGFPVLSGGRYDRLMSSFGRELPATGFAVSVDRLLSAASPALPSEDVKLRGFDRSDPLSSYNELRALRAQGIRAAAVYGGEGNE